MVDHALKDLSVHQALLGVNWPDSSLEPETPIVGHERTTDLVASPQFAAMLRCIHPRHVYRTFEREH